MKQKYLAPEPADKSRQHKRSPAKVHTANVTLLKPEEKKFVDVRVLLRFRNSCAF